jgi:hypothetical protein
VLHLEGHNAPLAFLLDDVRTQQSALVTDVDLVRPLCKGTNGAVTFPAEGTPDVRLRGGLVILALL